MVIRKIDFKIVYTVATLLLTVAATVTWIVKKALEQYKERIGDRAWFSNKSRCANCLIVFSIEV